MTVPPAGATLQHLVSQYLIRHRSILDVQSKLHESTARISRALAKAVATCGCVQIHASRQRFPTDIGLGDLRGFLSTHLQGEPCERCREILEDRVSALGVYHLT